MRVLFVCGCCLLLPVISSFLSLVFVAGITHPTAYITGILGILLSPYAAIQQRKITETIALYEVNQIMDKELNTFIDSNKQLMIQNTNLKQSIAKLNTIQATLNQLSTRLSDLSIDEMEQQINESNLILNKMEQNYQTDILQNLITI